MTFQKVDFFWYLTIDFKQMGFSLCLGNRHNLSRENIILDDEEAEIPAPEFDLQIPGRHDVRYDFHS